ncbi:transporter YIP1 SCDLUD_004526 [Saccharomycodes ludwigii]|uniref:transporter YIP1 n=1 Tax=Saccharomycodes ludwigii TaxID=36035 RepID=UPI001E8C21DC|nr:hypothetical protein SCDLUD_004526 [Saccharomycodes ludwigii]KAH3899101.1 hypothetical protein SCDLUD_004526 [Saccharomycodes ludwigii]
MSFYNNNGFYQPNSSSGYSFPQGSMNTFNHAQPNSTGTGGNIVPEEQLPTGLLNAFSTRGYSYEPPLLEELGINFHDIWSNTKSALLLKKTEINDSNSIDLTGPLFFVLIYGIFLLMSGKLHFGYIYGVGLFGSLSLHFLLKLMGNNSNGLQFLQTTSILGYSFLPLCILSGIGIFLSLHNIMGLIISLISVCWCTFSSSGKFMKVLQLNNARALVAYPLFIFYTVFASMAVFV